MFLLILDKNPIYSAELVPNGIVLKQVVELCQLICSAGISDVYKPIKQGKKLQEWIKKNPEWTYIYLNILMYREVTRSPLRSTTWRAPPTIIIMSSST